MLSSTPSSTLQVNTFLNLSHGVCTSNPTNIRHLLRSNFSNFVKGSRFRDNLHDLLGHGIFNVDSHLWSLQRKLASPEFSTSSLNSFISQIVTSEIENRLIPCLNFAFNHDSNSLSRVLDLDEIFRKFAFDNICNLVFGVDPARLNSQPEQDSINCAFGQAFDDAVQISFSRLISPLPLIWKVKRFLNLGSEKRLKESIKIINDFTISIIRSKEEEVEEERKVHQDLLSRFMSSTLNNPELGFADEEERRKFLRDIVISFVLAGKDSTSTALTWFFWLISGNPRCEKLILDELPSSAGKVIFSYDELRCFNYLHACISEALRLFPPVPINSRLTVDDDVLPDGTKVKKGWFADYSAYAVGRNDRVWGEQCKEFVPERWLDERGVYKPSDQYEFPVFHCGPRMCLGKDMAYVQMKCVAAAVISQFEVVAEDAGGRPRKLVDPPYILSIFLKKKGGLPVRLKRRPRV
ncbi:Cytochrome P450 [Dillenia turbinata]|uniref:Cytochrome P450 n=1 Tax=Dillenia turbinata TaxID=194707 RepID=A0AAN8VNB4_9MAGN